MGLGEWVKAQKQDAVNTLMAEMHALSQWEGALLSRPSVVWNFVKSASSSEHAVKYSWATNS